MCFKLYIQRIKQKFSQHTEKDEDNVKTKMMMTMKMHNENPKEIDDKDEISLDMSKEKQEYLKKMMGLYYAKPQRIIKGRQLRESKQSSTAQTDGI